MFSAKQYKTVDVAFNALMRASKATELVIAHARELSPGASQVVIEREAQAALAEIRAAKDALTNV